MIYRKRILGLLYWHSLHFVSSLVYLLLKLFKIRVLFNRAVGISSCVLRNCASMSWKRLIITIRQNEPIWCTHIFRQIFPFVSKYLFFAFCSYFNRSFCWLDWFLKFLVKSIFIKLKLFNLWPIRLWFRFCLIFILFWCCLLLFDHKCRTKSLSYLSIHSWWI